MSYTQVDIYAKIKLIKNLRPLNQFFIMQILNATCIFIHAASSLDSGLTLLNTTSISASGSHSGSISDHVTHGETFQFLLRCKSNIGLVASVLSQTITMIQEAPNMDDAAISIISQPGSIFPERDNYVSNLEQLWIKWNDVTNDVAIDHCEVRFLLRLRMSDNLCHQRSNVTVYHNNVYGF